MQFTTILAVVACAATASVSAYEQTKQCPFTEYLKLAPLASNPNLDPCQTASGWTMLPPSGEPTAAQRAIMCQTPQCFALIDAVLALNPSDCMLVFGTAKLNAKQLAEEFEAKCFV